MTAGFPPDIAAPRRPVQRQGRVVFGLLVIGVFLQACSIAADPVLVVSQPQVGNASSRLEPSPAPAPSADDFHLASQSSYSAELEDPNEWFSTIREPARPGRAAEVVVEGDGSITVIGGELGLQADSFLQVLRELGVDARDVEEPASPSRVGEVGWLTDGPEEVAGLPGDERPGALEGVEPVAEDASIRIWPHLLRGPLQVHRGREPLPGESSYALTGSAFSQGEELAGAHCGQEGSITPDELERAALDSDVEVEWTKVRITDLPDGNQTHQLIALDRRPGAGLIVRAQPVAQGRVLAIVHTGTLASAGELGSDRFPPCDAQ